MEQIYFNGTIITLEKEGNVEAILVKDKVIERVGTIADLTNICKEAQLVDLHGATMLPAFIDAHSHYSATANSFLQVSLEETNSIEELLERIEAYIENNDLKEAQWIIGSGYDHNEFQGKKHPTKEELDKVSNGNPILITHKSGHAGVFNSQALKILGVDINTPNPNGGIIGRENGKLNGYMEENALLGYMKKVPMARGKELFDAFEKAQMKYIKYGISTMQEGMMISEMVPLYKGLLSNNILIDDLVAYIEISKWEDVVESLKEHKRRYSNKFKVGGFKIFLDGSPQARTAWMLTPYKNEENYYGYGTMDDNDVCQAVRIAVKENMQILAHCNGDAAAEQYINAIRTIKNEGYDVSAIRPVMIHAQFLNKDQLADVRELGIIPSFFVAHVYHWGDVHINNFGYERAAQISLTKSALTEGISFTFHQDSPVIEPNMLETIQCAVNRVTKKGVVLGEEEEINVIEAIKAVTINAAYQYFEEDIKGSIKEGKKADFVILNKNPLLVGKDEIKDIKILATIKDGKRIYTAK